MIDGFSKLEVLDENHLTWRATQPFACPEPNFEEPQLQLAGLYLVFSDRRVYEGLCSECEASG